MSKVTTRVTNQDIINTVRQQYENKQRSKLPTVIVDLPSKGTVYPKSSPLHQGTVEMRYMTAYDEDILTNTSYFSQGVLFDKLLESIIVSDINIADIAPLDRDALIIYARILSYGKEYDVTVTDPATKTTYDRVIDLSKIKHKPLVLMPDENGEFDYKISDTVSIKFRYNAKLKENMSVSQILTAIITQVGNSRKSEDIENFIRYDFLAGDSKRFRTYYIENAPGLDYNYEFEGENGGTFTAVFQINADIFWT
jgi:hypothetical protein